MTEKSTDNFERIRRVMAVVGIIVIFFGFWGLVYINKCVPAKNPTTDQILNYIPSARRTVIVRDLERELSCDQETAETLYDHLDAINIGKIANVQATTPYANGTIGLTITTEDCQYIADLDEEFNMTGVIDITPL